MTKEAHFVRNAQREHVPIEQLVKMYTVWKLTCREIGRIINMEATKIAERLDSEANIVVEEAVNQDDIVFQYVEQEYSAQKIADLAKIPRIEVYRILKKKGIKTRPRRFVTACAVCGKEIVVQNNLKKKQAHFFCSKEHTAEWRRKFMLNEIGRTTESCE